VQGLRAKRPPDRPFGEQLRFDSSNVAERRRFEIVNPAALNAPTQELPVLAPSRLRRHREEYKVRSPFFLQCKGKGVNGEERQRAP
jgi:hypothetical protein